MKKCFLTYTLLASSSLLAFEKLPDPYLVKYGSHQAPLCIVQYFSFMCPHCIALFKKEFRLIKKRYINTGKLSWVFHPVPMDLVTVQGMECLSKLSEKEKPFFLEAILEEIFFDQPKYIVPLMQKAMEIFNQPLEELQEKSYLSKTDAFYDAFQFLKQADELEAIPSIDVNGTFLPAQIPDIAFIETILQKAGIPNDD